MLIATFNFHKIGFFIEKKSIFIDVDLSDRQFYYY